MECKHCKKWMIDPRGGSGSWAFGQVFEGSEFLNVITHRSEHNYVCLKCGHRERVEAVEVSKHKVRFSDVKLNTTSHESEDN